MIKKWHVIANRTAQSILGAASAVCKDENGRELEFDTHGAAQAYKDKLNAGCSSGNVFYTVEPKETVPLTPCCHAPYVSALSPTGYMCDKCGKTLKHPVLGNAWAAR